ncbi:MAG: chorismate mutase [Bacteroidales bacterium]
METEKLEHWNDASPPLIISGPCSAESEKQVLETAQALAKLHGISVFRAGVWKPRTRPGDFEGQGLKALSWLKKATRETGLKTAVETGLPEHVKACLDHGIDIIWIGARTAVSPFAIQDIAKELKGQDLPVMVKNPVNADLDLWIGAMERINEAGIKKIIAVHRGFYTYKPGRFRNDPLWEMPIELRRRIPGLPIVCDPSHICGKKECIREIAQKALNLGFDGLMIESHIRPGDACTDAAQQLSPAELSSLLQMLVVRDNDKPDDCLQELEKLRSLIDKTDEDLLRILSERHEIVKQVARIKREYNQPAFQPERWRKVLEDRVRSGIRLGLDTAMVKAIMEQIHRDSVKNQSDFLENDAG